jgi:hypothetical protein
MSTAYRYFIFGWAYLCAVAVISSIPQHNAAIIPKTNERQCDSLDAYLARVDSIVDDYNERLLIHIERYGNQ